MKRTAIPLQVAASTLRELKAPPRLIRKSGWLEERARRRIRFVFAWEP
jgi:hypothetical protein